MITEERKVDKRYLYEVTFMVKTKIDDSFYKKYREVWTASTLSSRLNNPFFLIIEVRGRTYEDTKTIQNAIMIEAMAIK